MKVERTILSVQVATPLSLPIISSKETVGNRFGREGSTWVHSLLCLSAVASNSHRRAICLILSSLSEFKVRKEPLHDLNHCHE